LVYLLICVIAIYALVRWQKREWYLQQEKFNKQLAQMRYIHQLEIEKNEKEIVKLQNEKLENEVLSKTKELASTSMQLMENSGALTKLRVELSKLDLGDEEGGDLKKITSLLKDVEKNTAHWDQFASHFDELNDGFLHRLKARHPALSRNDLKVCAYLRLNFTSKQIAQLQNISVRGVEIHRYRIRKKMGIETEVSTSDYLSDI
jgi:DNA-binding CsgD family transcriptional regulator